MPEVREGAAHPAGTVRLNAPAGVSAVMFEGRPYYVGADRTVQVPPDAVVALGAVGYARVDGVAIPAPRDPARVNEYASLVGAMNAKAAHGAR